MLTVKAPIELKCSRAVIPSQETFYHKITDNYQLITSDITGEDLLHLVTAPPEIYLGEGGMTSIVSNTRVQNIRETNLNVVNNLLNRIALTEDVNLTYQDRVYITRVLHKLGIRNVQEFMRQVNRLKEETDLTEHLISLYWNHMEELSWIVDTYQDLRREQHTDTQETREETRYYLHEDIMNRLQTGAVYQILSNFYSSYAGDSSFVNSQELQISEQKRTVSQILLTQLKGMVQDRQIPLVYRHENYYENMELEETEVSDSSVSTQITSAVLLNLIDNLYFSRYGQSRQEYTSWLSLQNALYQSAQNTISRLRTEAVSVQTVRERRELAVYRDNLLRTELVQAVQLLQPEEAEEEAPLSGERTEAENIRELYDFYERTEHYLSAAQAVPPDMRTVFERTQTAYLQPDEQGGAERIPGEYTDGLPARERELIRQEVTNRILTREYVSPLEQARGPQPPREEEAAGPAKAENIYREGDALTYLTREEAPEGEPGALTAGEQEQIAQQLRQIHQQNIENYNRYQQLLAARTEQTARRGQQRAEERTRQASLKALADPQQMMEEYRQERAAASQQGEERIRQMISLLPEQTRRIYEQLEQYRENPERFRQSGGISRDNVGLLMRDIQEIERENAIRQQTTLEQREQERIREVSETVLEKWQERPAAPGRERRQEEFSREDVSLIHRSVENALDEELLQELILQNRRQQEKTQVTEQVTTEHQTINRTVHEVEQQTQIREEQQNISEMIRRGIQSQVRPLSEQVYNKLERRLMNEKRRRGF